MKPLYEQVYDSLKNEILSEKYDTGDRVPSEKELASFHQVSTITIRKALEKLVNEGYVYRKRGIGTIVSKNDDVSKNGEIKSVSKIKNKKPLIGLIVTSFDGSFGNTLITSVEEASEDKCFIILKRSDSNPAKEDKIINELIEFGVDGLIILPAHAEHYNFEILKMVVNQFPLILIDRCFKGLAVSSVSTDNIQAAKLGMHHLFDLGHEHIGVLLPENTVVTAIEDRITGIVEAFSERKIAVNKDLWCSNIEGKVSNIETTKKNIEIIKNHLKQNPKITALFALEYNIALLAKKAVEESGLRVPEDISILCFDSPPDNQMESNFSHLKQDEEQIGKIALDNLLKMFEGTTKTENIRIQAKLIKGDTTAQKNGTDV